MALLIIAGQGCAGRNVALRSGPTQPPAAWIAAHGGSLQDLRAERARGTGKKLSGADAMAPIRVHVLGSRTATAYAWPSGDVFVTAGLVDLLDDDALAAALAHEIGHLLDGGHIVLPLGLSGAQRGDSEHRADEAGVMLLGGDATARARMIAMLERVAAASSTSPRAADGMRRRIQMLRNTHPKMTASRQIQRN